MWPIIGNISNNINEIIIVKKSCEEMASKWQRKLENEERNERMKAK